MTLPPHRPHRAAAWLPTLFLGAVGFAALWPLGAGVASVARGLTAGLPELGRGWAGSFLASLGWGSLVAALATLLACPGAWASRRLPARFFVLLLVPLLMPSYLAYAGWGIIRAPDTWLGAFLMRGPTGPDGAPLPGPNPYPVIARTVLAVGGLALWAWPLPAMIIAAATRRIDHSLLDALRLEPASRLRRALTIAAILRTPVLTAFAATLLVMLGSTVPFHLAQVETYSIRIWRLLDETPRDQSWRVWAACWPLVATALAGGMIAARRAESAALSGDPGSRRQTDAANSAPFPRSLLSPAMLLAALVWSASVLAPVALFASGLKSAHAFLTFWRVSGPALLNSLAAAAAVALLALLVGAASWAAASSQGVGRRAGPIITRLFLVAGLLPGILIGSATAAAWNQLGANHPALRPLADTSLLVILGHTARYAFVPALLGLFLAGAEPREERDLRSIDGADTLRGWFRACLPLHAGPLAAGALACLALSLHEIESSIFLQPPGPGHFATQMLQLLHFERTGELCAAAVCVILGGLAASVGFIGLALLGRAARSV